MPTDFVTSRRRRALLKFGILSAAAVDSSRAATTSEPISATAPNCPECLQPSVYRTAADFGAIGDGVTDDTAALQRWMATGGNLRSISGKIYRITSPLFLTSSNTLLDLTGSTIVQTTAGAPWLHIGRDPSTSSFVKTDNVTVLGGESIGSVEESGPPGYGITVAAPSDNPYIDGHGCNNICIERHSSHGFTGGFIATGASNIRVDRCHSGAMVYHPSKLAGGYGFLFQTCYHVTVCGCRELAGPANRHFAYISADPSRPYSDDNVCVDVRVSGNQLSRSAIKGATGFEYGIVARGTHRLKIDNNLIDGGFGGAFLNLQNGSAQDVEINDNVISNLSAGKSATAGVGTGRSSGTFRGRNIAIRNNIIRLKTANAQGIALYYVDGLAATGNSISAENGLDGLLIGDSTNVLLSENDFTGDFYCGLGFTGAVEAVMVGLHQFSGAHFRCGHAVKYYAPPASILFQFKRTAIVKWSNGVPNIIDPDNIIEAAAPASDGFSVTFRGWVPLSALDYSNLSFTNGSHNVCAYYVHSQTGQTLTIGTQSFDGLPLPASLHDYYCAIHLLS